MRTVGGRRSRAISWSAITSNLLPVPALSIVHHQLLPTTAGNGCHLIQELDWLDSSIASQDEVNLLKGYLTCGWILPAIVMTPYVIYKQVNFMVLYIWGIMESKVLVYFLMSRGLPHFQNTFWTGLAYHLILAQKFISERWDLLFSEYNMSSPPWVVGCMTILYE